MSNDSDGAPARFKTSTRLDEANDIFHSEYGQTRSYVAHDTAVFVLLSDTLTLLLRGRQHIEQISPATFHVLKSAAHAPVALYAALMRHPAGMLTPETRARLTGLRDACAGALAKMPNALSPSATEALSKTVGAIETALQAYHPEALATFAASMRSSLTALADETAEIQLTTLDQKVRALLPRLDESERNTFEVVVAGDHQARVRSFGMQYFAKLCGERPGVEDRVAYGEGVTTVAGAMTLVGTRRVDRQLARAFFGDSKRLQQDVLGDAVAKQLARPSKR